MKSEGSPPPVSPVRRGRGWCVVVALASLEACLRLSGVAYAGRASASHIWRHGYDADLAVADLVYAEVRVETSVAGIYPCATGGNSFYLGFQKGGAGYDRHVHFSVWDPCGDIAWKAPDVQAQRFGGEGTGWATYWPFAWPPWPQAGSVVLSWETNPRRLCTVGVVNWSSSATIERPVNRLGFGQGPR